MLADLATWLSVLVRGRLDRAFVYEIELWSHLGFLRTCWQEFFSGVGAPVLRKLATTRRVLETAGPRGLLRVALGKVTSGRRMTAWFRWCRGRYVEIRGNRVTVDGCRFVVDSPVICTELKSQLVDGRYEQQEREMVRTFLDPGLPVVELGGAIGVVACLTNRRLANPSAHVVVEANPDLLPLLERNRDLNGCRFRVLHRAVAYERDEVTFFRNTHFYAGNLLNAWHEAPEDAVRVPTTGLRSILDDFGFDRCALICDIEGAEFDVIDHEADTLRDRVVTLMVEVHERMAPELAKGFFPKLERLGFRAVEEKQGTYVLQNASLA